MLPPPTVASSFVVIIDERLVSVRDIQGSVRSSFLPSCLRQLVFHITEKGGGELSMKFEL